MDDVSVFRRFFVASNLLSEIIQGLMGGMANGIMGGGQSAPISTADQTANYGPNPYIDTTYTAPSYDQNSSDSNDAYQFPSG